MALLQINDLTVSFETGAGCVEAVSAVSFHLANGEILGLVGESGCGKSTVAYSLLGLLPPHARVGGSIKFDAVDIAKLDERALRKLRGNRIAMIFQDPMTALDPSFRIGSQLVETLRLHLNLDGVTAAKRAVELLRSVGISSPELRMQAYPHELSGGMRQRVALAIAISCNPDVLIADEPTTGLDVTIQAQVLQLIRVLLTKEKRSGVLLITHDLGVIANYCDRVAVMYAGKIVETGAVSDIFGDPKHPYTQGLLAAIPDGTIARGALRTIPGRVPALTDRGAGCRFAPRCPMALPVCLQPDSPPWVGLSQQREVACVQYAIT